MSKLIINIKSPTMATTKTTIDRYATHFVTINNFFIAFSHREAHTLLHKMMRAAFAREDILNKRDVLDLVFLKDELSNLITAAGALANHSTHRGTLEKFFRRWPAAEWNETLDMLFYAAIYDGFFTCPPNHCDIYNYCRGLHTLVRVCAAVHEANKPAQDM